MNLTTRALMAAAPIVGAAAIYMIGPGMYGAAAMVAGLVIGSVFARSYWELVYTIVWAVPALAAILLVAHDFFNAELGLRHLGYTDQHVLTVVRWAAVAAAAWLLSDAVWRFFRSDREPSEDAPPRRRRKPGMTSLAIARTTEDNQVFWFPSGPGMSVVFVGTSGSGKSGAFWAYVDKLLEWYDQGTVRFLGIDPKVGIELRKAEPIFHELVWQNPRDEDARPFGERVAEFLERVVRDIEFKLVELGDAGLDKHEPTPGDPAHVILADELLQLTAFMEPKYAGRIMSALGTILTVGRAAGYWLVAATQEANVSTAGDVIRQFQMRVCLRVPTATAVDVALGPGIRTEYGADAHKIKTSTPGVGYVYDSENNRVVKVRFNHVSKEDIARRMRRYRVADGDTVMSSQNYGDGVEVEEGESQPAVPAMVDRVIAAWPRMNNGSPYVNVHLSDLADILGIAEDEVRDGLSAAGVHTSSVQRRPVGAGRDAPRVRADGVEWDELGPLAA